MAKKKKYEEVYEQLIQARNLNTSDEVAKAEKYVNENRPGPKTVNFPVKSSTYRKKLEELTKEKALANIALRQGDIAGTNKFKSVTEKYNKEYLPTSQKYNEEKDKEEAETISKTSEKDLANIDRYNKGANVSDSNIGKVFEYADAVKELRKEGYTIDDIKNIASGRKRQTNATEMAEKEKESAEFAAEHKVLSSILSVPQSVVGGVTGSASAAAQFILDPFRKIDTNEAAFTGSNEASAIRNEVSKDMSPLGRFIYETGMSLTDSLAGGLLGRAAKLGKAGSQFMMGSMSMENTIQDVTERGGTPEQALFSGFANGFFEGFFEEFSLGKLIKLSEGGSKGLKQIAKDIGSSVLVNASEEAATEFSSIMYDTLMNGGISNSVLKIQEYMGQGMTEEEAKSTVARDFAIQIGQAGIGGALAGGALGGAGTVAGKINNRPNDNDNKVIEKETQERAKDKRKTVAIENEVNKRISESEEVNGVLSDTEKNNIRKAVEADVESGKFDVTTTELSTKEFDEIRKQVRNDLENGKISFKRVEETLFPEKAQRFNELVEKLKTADEDQRESIESELKTIKNDISKIIGSSKHLSKSYEQEILKNTRFERETSADDTELTKLLDKSAARAGLNNTPEAHDTYNLLNNVANDSGTEYVFTSDKELKGLGYNLEGRPVNGLVRYTKDGKKRVLINIDSKNALNVIVGHETTHLLKNTESYEKLKNLVIDYAKEKDEYDSRLEKLTELYKDTNANIEEELISDLIGEYVFTDEAFVKNLSAKQPNIFQKIYNHIKHLIKMATAGSKEAKQLEQIKNTFDKAYKEMSKASEADSNLTTETDSEIKYSVSRRIETEEDIEKYLSTAAKNKTKRKTIKAWQAGEKVILKSDKDIEEFIVDSVNHVGNKKQAVYGQVSDKLVKAVAEEDPNMNIKDYYLELNPSYLEHAYNDHSIEDSKYPDNIPLTMEDMINLPNHIEQFTDILEVVNKEKEKKKIIIGTRVNGYTIIVNLVSDGRNAVRPLTIYKMNTESYLKRYGNKIKKKKVDVDAQAQKLEIGSNRTPSVVNSSSDKNIPYNNKYVKFSLSKADAEYNKAVKNEDIETAQRLVDEAAKNAGYTIKAYHGSRQIFNEFSKDKRGSNTRTKISNDWFFAADKETANSYYPYGVMKELARQSPNIWKVSNAEKMKQKGKLYNLYIKMENPLVVDVADYDYTTHRENADAWYEYTVQAEENGNDGIILLNAMDNQLKTSARESTVYMFKDPNQAKSADPITYDDNGNVIPLSERFNENKKDIRYSLSNSNQDIAPTKDYRIYGKDIKLKDNIAPVNINKSETISKKETVNNIAPVNPNIAKAKPAPAEAEPKKSQSTDKPARPLLRTEMKSISRSIKRSYGSTFDPTKDIMRLYNAMHSGKLTDEEATERATEIGRNIAENIKSKPMRTTEAQEVLDMLRNSRIKLDVEQISEVSKMYDGYNNYKQSMLGKVIISKNGIDLDTKWQELSEEYPHIFDPDVNPLEQPQELTNIIHDLQNSYEQQDIPDATEIGVEIYQKYFEVPERRKTHGEIQREKVEAMKEQLAAKGFDLDKILEDAKDKSTFSSVDNTPQRFTEKTFGYKEGQAINEFLGNKVALDEAEGVKWLNTITGKKDGLLAQLSREYNIKPGTKESAAAQMYGEGFFVDEFGDYRRYGDEELAQDFPDFETQNNIKGLANDPRIRKFYNETFDAINESRTRNGYDAIPKRENYFLHFFEMNDFFTLHGIPFNPNDIRKKDLPTELNGMTADLKPGQPYFASANRRMGVNTTYDLLRGIEQYAVSAEPQIYHIDNIQLYRGFRNYIADMYGKTKGLENLGALSEDEQQNRIEKVFDSHLSVYAKHLNEQANILAGKTALIDRGLEGILGRRGITTLNEINRQVGSNMVGFNISSAFTNYLAMVQAMAKLPLKSSIKGFTGLISNKIRSLNGYSDGFVESDPAMIRRKGADQFYRKSWQKVADLGYKLMSATDDMVTEFIVRAKYDELINNGMEDKEAHIKAGEWAMRLLGDRSKGQMPQIFNSKTLGLFTKFQLEVRNQLDSMFYDTNNEAKVSTETIQNERKKNIAKAAKITSTVAQLVIYQHIFGKAFESIAGYNPAFDILGVLITALGFDDDEDSEDTVLDNVEQGFLDLLEDMPYSSVLTGGRIPISQALPIKEVITGKDSYGNDKSRIKTITEAAPYYLMPTGYGQIKKTAKGLAMFDKNNPVSGSYTDSGNLRFPVEDTVLNRIQAGLFGQYANANARDYFDNERAPLKSKQIQEYKDLDLPIADYWKYRDGLKEQKTLEDKFNYIADLDLPVSKKNIMINNIVDREEKVDMTNYDDFSSYEEFDFATKNPEKYSFLESLGVSYKDYKSSEEAKEAYDWAYNNPDKCALAKAAAGDIVTYRNYAAALNDLKADKDSDGKTISGSRKIKVAEYINSLDADYGAKLILYKSEYKSDDQYNYEIIEYLNSRQDISYQEMVEILNTLGFVVDSQGYVRW